MTKPIVLCLSFAAAIVVFPASAASPAEDSTLQQAFETYDRCLAEATVRARRSGAPVGLVGDLSKRACAETRIALLADPAATPSLSEAFDALDRLRADYGKVLAQNSRDREPGTGPSPTPFLRW